LLRACNAQDGVHFCTSSIPYDSRIVCTVTGHGLKDPEVIASAIDLPRPIAPNEREVLRAIDAARS
jgi:threonine synthase